MYSMASRWKQLENHETECFILGLITTFVSISCKISQLYNLYIGMCNYVHKKSCCVINGVVLFDCAF